MSTWSYHNGIVIINTTKHFIIQDCILQAFWSAIFIENIAPNTARINNVICFDSDVGVGIKRSNGVEISDSTCGRGNTVGIFLLSSNFSIVKNNTCFQNTVVGITSQGSSSNKIEFNNVSHNFNTGIDIDGETNTTVSSNICNYNFYGIYVDNTSDSTISDNQFNYSTAWGGWFGNFETSTTNNLTITNNIFSFTERAGFVGGRLKNSTITNNVFSNNTLYGVTLDGNSKNNVLHHNLFLGNNPEGNSQALDSGKNNLWYEEATKEGNHWDDWTSRKPYPIDGSAESEDKYPLNSTLVRLNFQFLSFGSLFFLVFVFLYRKRKKIFNK
ncbi:MAG: NosD domain-containing protein [Candidatus Heimdallarchaeaceae archaeon]